MNLFIFPIITIYYGKFKLLIYYTINNKINLRNPRNILKL